MMKTSQLSLEETPNQDKLDLSTTDHQKFSSDAKEFGEENEYNIYEAKLIELFTKKVEDHSGSHQMTETESDDQQI